MKNEKTFLPPNLGLAPFCKSRGMTLQIAQLQHPPSSCTSTLQFSFPKVSMWAHRPRPLLLPLADISSTVSDRASAASPSVPEC